METDENAVKLTTLITSELQTLLKLRFGEVSPCSENNKFLSSLIKFWITIIFQDTSLLLLNATHFIFFYFFYFFFFQKPRLLVEMVLQFPSKMIDIDTTEPTGTYIFITYATSHVLIFFILIVLGSSQFFYFFIFFYPIFYVLHSS